MEVVKLFFGNEAARIFVINASACALLWVIFTRLEGVLQPDTRLSIARWVRGTATDAASPSWSMLFVQLFDRVFTDRHLSWRCFWRSCLASFGAALVMAVVAIAANDGFLRSAALPGSVLVQAPLFVGVALFGASVINLVPDYLSLLETRWVLRYLTKTDRAIATGLSLVADAVLTFLIFIVWAVLLTTLMGGWQDDPTAFDVGEQLSILWCVVGMPWGACAGDEDSIFLGIYLYTTFVTSLWIWLHLAAKLATRLMLGIRFARGFIDRHLQLEEKPFTVMAVALSVVVTAIIWPVYAIYSLIA